MVENFGEEDSTEIAFVGEFAEESGRGATSSETRIDGVGEVQEDGEGVDGDIDVFAKGEVARREGTPSCAEEIPVFKHKGHPRNHIDNVRKGKVDEDSQQVAERESSYPRKE